MKRRLLLATLVLISFLVNTFFITAQVTPVTGAVDPRTSTADAPKWYTVMSSHITATDRQNRFLVWDGTRLKTEKFDTGIPVDQLEEKYLWRLEEGSAADKVYIVNRSGMRINCPTGVSSTNNTELSVSETGVEWEMKLCSATGQSQCAAKQYCFNFLDAAAPPAYLNAMDAQNGDMNKAYGITVYNAGVHQASGWFFYEAVLPSYEVTYTGTAEGGTFVVKNGDEVVTSGSSIEEGTLLTVETTNEPGYLVKSVKINGEAIEGLSFTLAAVSEVTVEFTDKLVYNCTTIGGGSVAAGISNEPLADKAEFDRGSEVKLTVTVDDHYELSSLIVNSTERLNDLQDNVLVLTDMQDNLTVSATFIKKSYSVTFSSTGDGQLMIKNDNSPISSGNTFEYGTILTGTLTYTEPTVISVLTKNGEDILESVRNKTFSFTVDGPTDIVAEFRGATYTVNYSTDVVGGELKVTKDSDGSTITPGMELPKNTMITIVPEADKDYEVSTFLINGRDRLEELNDNDGEYWITIAESVEITVTFAYLQGVKGGVLSGVYYNSTISTLNAPAGSAVKVYDITGSLVVEGKGAQNLSKLPTGNYIAKVRTDGDVRTIKFIKK